MSRFISVFFFPNYIMMSNKSVMGTHDPLLPTDLITKSEGDWLENLNAKMKVRNGNKTE